MADPNALSAGTPRAQPKLAQRRDDAILLAVRAALRRPLTGRIRLTLPSGATEMFGNAASETSEWHSRGVDAAITLKNFNVFWRSLRRGSIGVADAYMSGDFDTPNLADLFRFYLDNRAALTAAGKGRFRVGRSDTSWHRARDNSRGGSRENIAAHYDLGNAFYAPWLDASMTYSSAIYANPNQTLEAAQSEKLDRIVAALDVRPGQRVLEIGCGWGALAERLARAGCHVTAVTVSREQFEFACARLQRAGVADLVDVQFRDYRDIEGEFDRVVSVEMIEAVGEAHWPAYFRVLSERLTPGGHAVIQAITIREDLFDRYRAKADFIQRYIFPGGMLPTDAIMAAHAARVRLGYRALETFGGSYCLTLREWRRRFEDAWPALQTLGFDERFRCMWLYYLDYSDAGFDRGATNVGLYRFDKSA